MKKQDRIYLAILSYFFALLILFAAIEFEEYAIIFSIILGFMLYGLKQTLRTLDK